MWQTHHVFMWWHAALYNTCVDFFINANDCHKAFKLLMILMVFFLQANIGA